MDLEPRTGDGISSVAGEVGGQSPFGFHRGQGFALMTLLVLGCTEHP